MKLHDLVLEERVSIKILIGEGYNRSQIGERLDRHRSTIGRELKKWGIVGDLQEKIKDYDPGLAQWYKMDGKSIKKRFRNKLDLSKELLKLVLSKLKKRWSPEQISNWLKKTYKYSNEMRISHESIYNYIYNIAKGDEKDFLISCLRRKKRIRKSNRGRKKGSKIKERVSIEERPQSVENREEIGHWEGDLIIGKDRKTVIGTLVERTTRYTLIVRPKSRKSKDVVKAFTSALKKLPSNLKKSLTYDNGTEMSAHKLFTEETEMPVYFCHPYSSWERGTNENTNGLIRDFWPKRSCFKKLTKYEIKKVERLLNERPRKVINWDCPQDLIEQIKKECAVKSG